MRNVNQKPNRIKKMKTSHSQSKEDIIIAHDIGIIPELILDIGANDGRTFSNSLSFIKEFGSAAVCVEADPYAFCKLFEEHKHRSNVHTVLGTVMPNAKDWGITPFTLFSDSLISTADEGYRNRWKSSKRSEDPIYTSSIDWWDLMDARLKPVDKPYDMISLDPEGLSPELMDHIPTQLIDECKVFVIERGKYAAAGGSYVKNNLDCYSMLNETHKLYHETSENLIYVRK